MTTQQQKFSITEACVQMYVGARGYLIAPVLPLELQHNISRTISYFTSFSC